MSCVSWAAHSRIHQAAIRHPQAGLTIVELMVSIAVGLLVVLAVTALLLSTKTGYIFQDEGARLQETGRYAIESITRAVRQAGYENWDTGATAMLAPPEISANIAGLDASGLKESEIGIEAPLSKSVNGSDVLAVRFTGSGSASGGDGTLLNCAGFGVAAPIDLETDRGWSIFYVALDKSGEPELRCKYFGKTSWNTEAIARGIETFQVLYGLDTDDDGVPNQFLNASAISKLDKQLVLDGPNAAERLFDKNRRTHWKKVVTIKIAILARSGQVVRADARALHYDLFSKEYGDTYGSSDIGTRIDEAKLPPASRNRHRKVFASTIQLRNRVAGSGV
jgi:type IV pilus assembly protein PilW